MYPVLLTAHSILRYFVLIFLLAVIVKSLMGYSSKSEFGKTDNRLSIILLIVTHTQFLLGILLYFSSPWVKFSGDSMKDPLIRYWTTEHVSMMIIAIGLITFARISSKKLQESVAKHKRLLIFNSIALVIILAAIAMSKRGFFGVTTLST